MKDYGIELNKLYHYSTPAGLAGMLRTKKFWMTNIRYQNDIEEYDYAFTLTRKVIDEEYGGFSYHSAYTPIEIPPIYTFSLTEREDLLSQWRGYCPNGGFSFSFEAELLSAVIEEHKLELVQIEYNIDKQKAAIRKIIGISPDEWKELKGTDKKILFDKNTEPGYKYYALEQGLKALGMTIAQFAPQWKHPSFEEEKEWRLIKRFSGSYQYDEGLLKFREAKDIVIPYLEIPLTNGDDKLRFASIKVGPGPRQKLAEQACKLIFPNATSSETPYRNW